MSTVDTSSCENQSSQDELAELRTGGKETLATLFLSYRDRLERMIDFRLDPRLLGRIDPADVVQEAYIEVAHRIDSFLAAPGVSLFVWLRQIAWQTLLDVHRRHLGQKRNAGQEVPLQGRGHDQSTACLPAQQLAGNLTSPSQAAMRNERVTLLKSVIDQLEEPVREILALRHFEQLTNNEVAEVLHISKTAASNRYMRALKRLRVRLDATETGNGGPT